MLYYLFAADLYRSHLGVWRNGRRDRLKICCPLGRASSSLATPILKISATLLPC
jgi:hypothetical protein